MKTLYFLFAFILFSIISYSQSKPQTNNSLLGNYEGYQQSYSMGQVYGRDVIVPGSTYKFKISVGNKVKLNQVADNGTEVSYSGKYTISSKKNTTTLSCQMIEDWYKYPSKPKFFIIIDKKTNKIICQQDSDYSPSFELSKPGFSNIILVDTSNTKSKKISSNNNLSEKAGVKQIFVNIGNQTWMNENLNVDTFRNGDPIPEAKTNDEWIYASNFEKPAWCYFYNNTKNSQRNGKLYNWYAVNDPRGLAPKGWHVATEEEWVELINFSRGKLYAGYALKSKEYWNGKNLNGFSALPSQNRGSNGGWSNPLQPGGYWWTSTGGRNNSSISVDLDNDNGEVNRNYIDNGCGFSVRCIKDIGIQIKSGQYIYDYYFRNDLGTRIGPSKVKVIITGEKIETYFINHPSFKSEKLNAGSGIIRWDKERGYYIDDSIEFSEGDVFAPLLIDFKNKQIDSTF